MAGSRGQKGDRDRIGNQKVLCQNMSGKMKAVALENTLKRGGRSIGDWKILCSNAKHVKNELHSVQNRKTNST